MKTYLYNFITIFLVTITFIIDKSFLNNFVLFATFSLSVLILLTMVNNHPIKAYWPEFVYLGFLIDLYYRNIVGISSIILLIILFVNNTLRYRFLSNKLMIIGLSAIVSVAFLLVFYDFSVSAENFLSIVLTVASIIIVSNYKALR